MAKTITAGTAPPGLFATGNGIYYEHLKEVIENQHYSWAENAHVHLSMSCGIAAWGSTGDELPTHGVEITGTGWSSAEKFRFWIWLDPDVAYLTLGVECQVKAGNTVNVRWTINGTQIWPFISISNSDNGTEKTTTSGLYTLSPSLPAGWNKVIIEATNLTGDNADNWIKSIRIEDKVLAAGDLRNPVVD